MKITFTIILAAFQLCTFAQVVAGFENFNLEPGKYLNDASPANGFESGSIILPNNYNAEFGVWSGFAISTDTNTTTPGFLNQYSSIVGEGAIGSTAYAMGYIFDPLIIRLKEKAIGKPMIGMYVTNSTYAYLSMRDGDAFAKKFGGETGSDPDFFLLTIKKYFGGVIADDSINVYLADYRSSNPSKDYILSEWKYIDLTVMGEIDSLVLSLSSSDVGIFGMNTPAYVAIDEVSTDNLLAASALSNSTKTIVLGPNPANDVLYIDLSENAHCTLVSVAGTVMWSKYLESGMHQIDVTGLPKGMYFMTANGLLASKVSIE